MGLAIASKKTFPSTEFNNLNGSIVEEIHTNPNTVSLGTTQVVKPNQRSGSRYPEFVERINKIQEATGATDKQILNDIQAILAGKKVSSTLEKYKNTLAEFARTVGHVEASRSNAVLAYNGMSADLIDAGKMSFEDVFSKLPFTQEGAVPAMRNISKKAGFRAADAHLVKTKATSSQIEEHMLRQQELFTRHFRLKAIEHSINIDDPKAVEKFQAGKYQELLEESIKKFYGV